MNLRKAALFYGVMAAVAATWIIVADFKIQIFGIRGFIEAIFLAPLIFALSLNASVRCKWARDLEKLFASVLTPLSTAQIFLLALISSVSEELLFRGAAQNQFGLVIASILFGFVHFPVQKQLVAWTGTAIVMGFLLGGLYLYAGNLLAPITLHFLINFLNIWAINQKYMSFS